MGNNYSTFKNLNQDKTTINFYLHNNGNDDDFVIVYIFKENLDYTTENIITNLIKNCKYYYGDLFKIFNDMFNTKVYYELFKYKTTKKIDNLNTPLEKNMDVYFLYHRNLNINNITNKINYIRSNINDNKDDFMIEDEEIDYDNEKKDNIIKKEKEIFKISFGHRSIEGNDSTYNIKGFLNYISEKFDIKAYKHWFLYMSSEKTFLVLELGIDENNKVKSIIRNYESEDDFNEKYFSKKENILLEYIVRKKCTIDDIFIKINRHKMNGTEYNMLNNNCQEWVVILFQELGIEEYRLTQTIQENKNKGK